MEGQGTPRALSSLYWPETEPPVLCMEQAPTWVQGTCLALFQTEIVAWAHFEVTLCLAEAIDFERLEI